MQATIILPNFNNERALPVLFSEMRRRIDCRRYAILFVDDGSEDESVRVAKEELARSTFGRSDVIELEHTGIIKPLNTALREAKTDYIIRIDGDATIETDGWAEKILAPLQEDQELGMIGSHILWETARVHSFGRSVISDLGLHDMGTVPLEPIGQRTYDSMVYRPRSVFSGLMKYEVDTVLGVCAAFRRDEALGVGGFDTRFSPVWIEDDDFGLALRRIGKRIVIDPSIHVVHRPSLRGTRCPGGKAEHVPLWAKLRGSLTDRLSGLKRNEIEDYFPHENNPWRSQILHSHYKQWHEKWGFDPINPCLADICECYWETPLCWRLNPRQYRESKRFIERLNSI